MTPCIISERRREMQTLSMKGMQSTFRDLRNKSGFHRTITLIVLFLSLQLYISLVALIYQRIELSHGPPNFQLNKGILFKDKLVIASILESLAEMHAYNSTKLKQAIRSFDLELKYLTQASYEREKLSRLRNDYSFVFTSVMSSFSFLGIGELKPTSPESTLFFFISLLLGSCLVLTFVIKTSYLLQGLIDWFIAWMQRHDAFSKVRPWTILFSVFLLLVLFGAPFFSSDYLAGLGMALGSVTKTGNYKLNDMQSRPEHPITALLFSSYIWIGLAIFVLLVQPLVKKLGQDLDSNICMHFKQLIKHIKITFYDKDKDILEEDPEKGKLESGRVCINTFDPPIRAPVRTRLKMYNKYVARPRSPMLVIKEVTPDLHGEFINDFENEAHQQGDAGHVSPLGKDGTNSDSWAEFIHEEDDKSSVSQYSFEGSFSSNDTDIEVQYLQRKDSGVSDTNVVTDYPWLDSDVNILELTEQNVQMMFGNDSSKSTDDSKDESRQFKRSLSRKNALDFSQRDNQLMRRDSNGSDDSEWEKFKRKISKSDERVNYCGRPGQGLVHRTSDITENPKLLQLADLDGDEFTKSDFFTNGRPSMQHPRVRELVAAEGPHGAMSYPNPSITVERSPSMLDESDAEIDSGDYEYDESIYSETGYEDIPSEGRKSNAPSDNKDYLDVHVVFPVVSGPQRTYPLCEQNVGDNSTPSNMSSAGSDACLKVDKNFARCFGGPARSLSDLSARSLRLIDMGDILYSDDESDSPDKKKPRVDTKPLESPLVRDSLKIDGDNDKNLPSTECSTNIEKSVEPIEPLLSVEKNVQDEAENVPSLFEREETSVSDDVYYDCEWMSDKRRTSGSSDGSVFFENVPCDFPTNDTKYESGVFNEGLEMLGESKLDNNGNSLHISEKVMEKDLMFGDSPGEILYNISANSSLEVTSIPSFEFSDKQATGETESSVLFGAETQPPFGGSHHTATSELREHTETAFGASLTPKTSPVCGLGPNYSSYISEEETRDTEALVKGSLGLSTRSRSSTEESSQDEADSYSDTKKLL